MRGDENPSLSTRRGFEKMTAVSFVRELRQCGLVEDCSRRRGRAWQYRGWNRLKSSLKWFRM